MIFYDDKNILHYFKWNVIFESSQRLKMAINPDVGQLPIVLKLIATLLQTHFCSNSKLLQFTLFWFLAGVYIPYHPKALGLFKLQKVPVSVVRTAKLQSGKSQTVPASFGKC